MARIITFNGQVVLFPDGSVVVEAAAGAPPAAFFSPTHFRVDNPGTDGDLDLVIIALPSDNGNPITDIKYSQDGGAWTSTGLSAPGTFAIAGLTNGQSYSYRIRGVNGNGDGDISAPVSQTPTAAATVPGTFGASDWSFVATGQSGEVVLTTITAPTDGGSTIVRYEYRLDGGTAVSLGTVLGPTTISSLTNDVSVDAEVRAVNGIGSGNWSAVKSATPTASAGGTYTPDATAASLASALSTLQSWAASWPGGATRYLRLDTGSYTTLTISDLTFGGNVILYGQGQNQSVELDWIKISNVDNLSVEYFFVTGGTPGSDEGLIDVRGGSDNVWVRYNYIEGAPVGTPPGGNYGVHFLNATNCGAEDNLVLNTAHNAFKAKDFTNVAFRRNMSDECGKDNIVLAGGTIADVSRNWGHTRDQNQPTGHLDNVQMQVSATTGNATTAATVWGNVGYESRFDHIGSLPASHGQLDSKSGAFSFDTQQNFWVVSNEAGVSSGSGQPRTISHNALVLLQGHGLTAPQNSRVKIKSSGANLTAANNVEVSNVSPVGTGSINMTTGTYSTYYGALRTGGDSWSMFGIGGDFSDAYPQTGQRTHWDHASPVGPTIRLKEIFVTGIHPGNSPNQELAAWWNATYNVHGRIVS